MCSQFFWWAQIPDYGDISVSKLLTVTIRAPAAACTADVGQSRIRSLEQDSSPINSSFILDILWRRSSLRMQTDNRLHLQTSFCPGNSSVVVCCLLSLQGGGGSGVCPADLPEDFTVRWIHYDPESTMMVHMDQNSTGQPEDQDEFYRDHMKTCRPVWYPPQTETDEGTAEK